MNVFIIINIIIFVTSLCVVSYNHYLVRKIKKQIHISNMLITDAVKQRDKTVDFIITTNNTNLINLDFVSEYIESKSENWDKYINSYILAIKQRIHILNEMLNEIRENEPITLKI